MSKVEHGKYPIDRPCSACGDGDYEMEYHDHDAPFRKGYGPAAASLPKSQPAPEMDALRKLAYSALYCLNIAVEPDIARDVYSKVHAYIEALRAHDARVQPSSVAAQDIAAVAYQCLGAAFAPERVLDYFGAAQRGLKLPPSPLPVSPEEFGEGQPSSVAGTGRDERWLKCPACHKKAFQRYEIYGDRLKCTKCGEWRNISEYMELAEAESALKESSHGK